MFGNAKTIEAGLINAISASRRAAQAKKVNESTSVVKKPVVNTKSLNEGVKAKAPVQKKLILTESRKKIIAVMMEAKKIKAKSKFNESAKKVSTKKAIGSKKVIESKKAIGSKKVIESKKNKTTYGVALIETRKIIKNLKVGQKLNNESFKTIKSNLMEHLFQMISEGNGIDTIYNVILHDIAPVMQVTEAIVERNRPVQEKDVSILGAYRKYLRAMNELEVEVPTVDTEDDEEDVDAEDDKDTTVAEEETVDATDVEGDEVDAEDDDSEDDKETTVAEEETVDATDVEDDDDDEKNGEKDGEKDDDQKKKEFFAKKSA
jgi:hypothetical protein